MFNPNEGSDAFSYVYYDELLNHKSEKWRTIGKQAAKHFRDEASSWPTTAGNGIRDIGNYLIDMAKKEYKREIIILSKYYGLDLNQITTDYTTDPQAAHALYGNVNALLQQILGAENTSRRVLELLNRDAVSQPGEGETGATGKARGYETSAPHLIAQIFQDEFNKYLRSAEFAQAQINGIKKKSDAVQIIRNAATKCMETAVRRVGNYARTDDPNTQQKDYIFKELHQIASDKTQRNSLVSKLISKYDINGMTTELIKDLNAGKTKKRTNQKKGYIGDTLTFGGRGQPGVLGELVAQAQGEVSRVLLDTKNGTFTVSAQFASGQGADTDLIYVTAKIGVDKKKIEQAFLQAQSGTGTFGANKGKYLTKMQTFVDELHRITNGNFAMIQETTKTYVIGTNFDKGGKGFGGTQYNYQSLKDLMHSLGKANADAMLDALLNMRAGTVIGKSDSLRDRARLAFATLFANMMFERPSLVTPGGSNIIYVFRLSGTVLPLSYVLRAAGMAALKSFGDLQNWMSFTISSPPASSLLYTGLTDYSKGSSQFAEMSKKNHLKSQEARWRRQREQAQSEFVVSIHFMQAFIDFLNGDLRTFMGM